MDHLTHDPIVKRLRWVMLGAMLFSLINTLAGQPESYWHRPETAIRGDGLPIGSSTNRTFEFFLGQGWQAYLVASLAYLLAIFLVVSILPRAAALIAAFSVVFGHYFGASNWLAVRWGLGTQSIVLYGILLSASLAFAAFQDVDKTGPIVRRLRWAMVGAIVLDFALTLLGQPASYWIRPETVNESNQLFRIFMAQGWTGTVLFNLIYISGAFLLVSILPRMTALICIFAFLFGHFNGASTWLFYRWRLGMEAPVAYGILLSAIIVSMAFSRRERRINLLDED
jgi:hypothetical protein